MSESTYNITFYGIIQPGKDKEVVIQNMARLFKTAPEKVSPFFAGGRKVIKSGVDELTAEKYKTALENVGLVIKLETVEPAAPGATTNEEAVTVESGSDDISVAPVGADVLQNPPVVEPQPIGDISDITMAEVGADVIENPKPKEKAPLPDTSDLSVKDE